MNFQQKKNNNLIISLTSYPERIKTAHIAVQSLLNQTIKADKVILWLGKDKFPDREKDLPEELLELRKNGLEIEWCKDIGSYTKLIPALKKYPNSIIVTADDDIIYDDDRLEKLYYTHLVHSDDVICHRAHFIECNDNKISLYSEINKMSQYDKAAYRLFLTGVGMVLYPPKCFYKDVLKENLFLKLADNNDDIWFWAMIVLNKRKIRLPYNNYTYLNYIPQTQEKGLWQSVNKSGGGNEAFNRIIKKYPEIVNLLKEEKGLQDNGHEYNCAVSIVVPVYNMQKYLKRCLDSLINQTLKNIEIICINDGSTDNSLEILKEYAEKDSRITVINQENKKLSAARNAGIKKASGEYTAFIDSDDCIAPDFYEKLYNKAKADKADIVRAPYYWVYPDGTKKPDTINKIIQTKAEKNETLNFNEHSVIVWNAVYNTDFLKRYNILFDLEDINTEDVMFTAKCQLYSQKIKSISDSFYYYMQDNPNSTKSINVLRLKCNRRINLKLIQLLNKSRLKKEFYDAEFKRAMWRCDYMFKCGIHLKDLTRKEKTEYLKAFCKSARLYKKEYGSFEKLYPYNSIYRYIYDGDIHSYKNIIYNRKKNFLEKYIFASYMEYNKKSKHRIINILGIKLKIKK